MKLRYTRRARRHLDGISHYIAERNPTAGRQVGARIHETIVLLGVYPNIGREGALAGTRELVVPGLPYIVVHRIDSGDAAVTILGIYHGAQVRPGQEVQ
jgi:plasmid stabilization system protein ParE